ncbi:MAG: transcription termination factor Rho [Akkermansiaceae bacterium]|nr:transcription termination factor Rho [Akkermansiaceae bacterium]
MRVLALTGGIASGKSTVVRWFRELLPGVVVFDSDAAVRALLDGDAGVAAALLESFGEGVVDGEGKADRGFLRERVFGSPEERKKLEAILHPRVRKECLALLERAARNGAGGFVADIPLFFETGFDFGQDEVIVVACSRRSQIERVKLRNGFDDRMIGSMLYAQLPGEEKIRRADVVFWNEGPPEVLEAQVRRFCQAFPMTSPNEIEASDAGNGIPADVPAASPSGEATAPGQDAVAVEEQAPVETPPKVQVPPLVDVNLLRLKSFSELQAMAEAVPARIPGGIPKTQLVYELLCFYGKEGAEIVCEGILEGVKENFAMLRDPHRSFRPGQDDIHVSANLLREHGLRIGQKVKVHVKVPREKDKYMTAGDVIEIEGIPVADFQQPTEFDKLTPLFPDQRIHLEGEGTEFLGVRVIDLIAPLGKGQRGLIVAPPRGGKTILLKQIAKSIKRNHPEAELVILLLDERPEEVTDFEETVGAEVFASTFDESPKRHAQVADMVIERAKRLVEQGKDVILLLDSLTRLARGHNSAMQGGPIGSGGVSPVALQKSRKFFGTARNVEEGGSLTILATALVETESRLDDVVFEEFKGTGNMEVRLDRELAERRVFPAIHIPQSGTRNDDRLYHPDEFVKVVDVRRQLAQQPIGDAIESLLSNLKGTKTNAEFLLRGLR